jgi:Ca2+-binding RTX toxin-like protein
MFDVQFWSSNAGTAHDADDRIIYNTSTGRLFYDSDGNGAGAAVQIAIIGNRPSNIASNDFVIVA